MVTAFKARIEWGMEMRHQSMYMYMKAHQIALIIVLGHINMGSELIARESPQISLNCCIHLYIRSLIGLNCFKSQIEKTWRYKKELQIEHLS